MRSSCSQKIVVPASEKSMSANGISVTKETYGDSTFEFFCKILMKTTDEETFRRQLKIFRSVIM